uniref:Candidate secreted effector n=2 Tax=Meloidogyne TaxID=189290 RepID=A0A914NVU7_MELIC
MNKFHIFLLLLVILAITVLNEAAQTAALENSDSRMLVKREVAAIRAKRFGWGMLVKREVAAIRAKRFGWGCCGGGGIGLFWGGR